jgi:hypothetical protein
MRKTPGIQHLKPARNRAGQINLSAHVKNYDSTAPKNSLCCAQTGCMGAKLPPQYYSILALSIFAEWGLVKADTRRGAFRVKQK